MSRHTNRRRARVTELADELAVGAAIRLRCESDSIRPIVDAVVAYLIEEYPSQDLYIPASPHPAESIRRDLAAGVSMRAICQRYRIARRTAYRMLDEGNKVAE